MLVSKESSNESVNEAERHSDFWIFGGIYRPVYLEAHPAESIERVAIDARHDGAFRMDVHLGHVAGPGVVTAQIETTDGQPAGAPFSAPVAAGAASVTLETRVDRPAAWTAESPNLYRVVVSLERAGKALHTTTERFGFRTVELRPRDGLYVNGVKVRLKGVNRHSFWPDSGRTTSRAVSEMDVRLIKDMNMNAVRMSHYPPDRHFLEVCDELGLYVLDELTGWQHRYDTEVGRKLVRELVVRDVNHPSVIFWDNGNEGGFNYDLVDDYALHDPQKRPVIHPWQNEAGKINTTHYRAYDCCAGKYLDGPDLVMPTEVLHGLYDGGHGAGLADLWSRMLQNPLAVGRVPLGPGRRGRRAHRPGRRPRHRRQPRPGRHRRPVPREGGELLHDPGGLVARSSSSSAASTACRPRSTDGCASRTATTSPTSPRCPSSGASCASPGPAAPSGGPRRSRPRHGRRARTSPRANEAPSSSPSRPTGATPTPST